METNFSKNNGTRGCLMCSSFRTVSVSEFLEQMSSIEVQESEKSLEAQLLSIFILRRLLEYPKEECEQLLKRMGGIHPGQWYKICGSCRYLVQDAWKMQKEMLELQKKIAVKGKEAKEKLKRSLARDEDVKERKDEFSGDNIFCVRDVVRKFYQELPSEWAPGGVPAEVSHDINMESAFEDGCDLAGEDFQTEDEDSLPILPDADPTDFDYNVDTEEELAASDESSDEDPEYMPSETEIKLPKDRNARAKYRAKYDKFASKLRKVDRTFFGYCGPGKKKYPCPDCSESFTKKSLRKLHIFSAHQKQKYNRVSSATEQPSLSAEVACSSLSTSVQDTKPEEENSNNFKTTRKGEPRPHPDGKFHCALCPAKVASVCELIRHVDSHEKFKDTSCHFCNFPTSSKAALEKHLKSNHKEHVIKEFFQCEKCNFICKFASQKSHHMEKHKLDDNAIPDSAGRYSCGLCPGSTELFDTRPKMHLHLRQHHGEELGVRYVMCVICGKAFNEKVSLDTHIKWKHEEKKFHCDQCGTGFFDRPSLNYHYTSFHTDKQEEPSICDICGNSFANKRSLMSHKHRIHATFSAEEKAWREQKAMKCRVCGFQALHRRALTNHMNAEHGHLYTIQCQYCPTKFLKHYCLLRHLKKNHAEEEGRK